MSGKHRKHWARAVVAGARKESGAVFAVKVAGALQREASAKQNRPERYKDYSAKDSPEVTESAESPLH
jgi:hypothetical protein